MTLINIKSLNNESINLYKKFLRNVLDKLNIDFKMFQLPTQRKRITILKSPHVNKSAREQFEFKSYKCTVFIKNRISTNKLHILLLNKPKTIKITIKNLGG
jgi:ribosomal protein S10